jgi:pyruvate-formate lyase
LFCGLFDGGTDAAPPTFVIYRTNGGDGVATKAEDYRAKARECEESAAKTQDSFIRQQMLEIAEKWRHMADREAKRSR